MILRSGIPHLVASAVLWSVICSLCGFVISRYIIDLELRHTSAAVLRTAEDLDRYETAMAEQLVTTTQVLNHKIEALGAEKEHR